MQCACSLKVQCACSLEVQRGVDGPVAPLGAIVVDVSEVLDVRLELEQALYVPGGVGRVRGAEG